MIFFYNIFRIVYKTAISVASGWNTKAKKWVDGRRNWKEELSAAWKKETGHTVIWMHCASLGEFEQGRPILEKLRLQMPTCKIVLTFFSPSGYEIRKNYSGADYVMYLPFDSADNAKTFLDLVQPQLAIFVKYEFWHYYLEELHNRRIETILVSGIFRLSQPFFQWWGGFHRNMLNQFSQLFVQNIESKELLDKTGFANQTIVAGDTRFDRVLAAAEQWTPVDHLALFCADKKILVAGSTWAEDEQIIAGWMKENNTDWKLILAPHEIKEENLKRLKELFPGCVLFSDANSLQSELSASRILIINNIGFLSRIYKYATVCYVGGGFNKSGHHNILEAAVYSKPVITGPNFQKFKESVDLKKTGAGFTVENKEELKQLLQTLNFAEAGKIAAAYVRVNGGATVTIINWLQEKRLFTSV